MVKITRTSTKYPSPTDEFLPCGYVALCFPCISPKQRHKLHSMGTNLLPQLIYRVVFGSARGGVHRFFATGKENLFHRLFRKLHAGHLWIFQPYFSSHLLSTVPASPPSTHLPPLSPSPTSLQGQTEISFHEDVPAETQRAFKRSSPKGWGKKKLWALTARSLPYTFPCVFGSGTEAFFSDICTKIWDLRALGRVELLGMLPASKFWPPPVQPCWVPRYWSTENGVIFNDLALHTYSKLNSLG